MIPRFTRRPSVPSPAPTADPPPLEGMLERGLSPRPAHDRTRATDILYARLADGDQEAVTKRVEPQHRWMWESASPEERKRLTLSFGLLYGIEGIAERTGLSPSTPPQNVHSMVHGWVTEIGGSYYLADLVLDAMDEIGRPPTAGAMALDFSCSSGRVVRPLAAALPQVGWHGCDPNAGAIAWLRDNVPAVEAVVSPTNPPLPFATGTFDLVFAISVWSHYSAPAALRWLEELHRVVRPGGHVLLTTHGLQACVWFTNRPDPAIDDRLGAGWILETAGRLQQVGHCFWPVFGEQGDWGVVDREWGLAFFTPEWLLENITPRWSVPIYRIGRAHGNQDVYVLERR